MKKYYLLELELCFGFGGFKKTVFTNANAAQAEYIKYKGCGNFTARLK